VLLLVEEVLAKRLKQADYRTGTPARTQQTDNDRDLVILS
jgi:hypothetical protein